MFSSIRKVAFTSLALGWALFQLALPRFLIVDSIATRSIHLAFALALTYLTIDFASVKYKAAKILLRSLTVIALFVAVASTLYIVFDWEGVSARAGRPNTRDIIISIVMIVFLLIAARKVIGLPMVIIALFFSLYAFAGPYLPGIFGYKGISMSKYINQLALSSEGIFGIPIDVSATTVYLFVLFGSMLSALGAGEFFNNLALALFGRFKGGPAKAAVISSGLTGMVSGSSIANVVTTGTFTIPLMKKTGYPGVVAAATEVAASTNGQLMPPIMGAAAFIIAEYLGIGYLAVVRAAFIPALVSYFALFYITHLEATRLNLRGIPRENIASLRDVMAKGWYHLIPIIFLMYDLMILRRSPKLAAFNAIIALIVVAAVRTFYIERGKPIAKILASLSNTIGRGMVEGSKNMLSVALATATAGIIVGLVNTGIGSLIVQIVEYISGGRIIVLLVITAIACLVLGMGLPTTATYIVMASITVPIIVNLGANAGLIIPAIAAHLFAFYFGILADDTPPVGLAAYTAAAIAKSNPFKTGIKGFIYDLRTAVIPFMFVFNPEILLVGISGFWVTILIFVSATMGALSFANLAQGWGIVKNRWYESILFLTCSGLFFLPGRAASLFSIAESYRYIMIPIAALIYAGTLMLQRQRSRANAFA